MVLVRNILCTSALFVFCCFYLPSPAAAGKSHGGNSGMETLLTAGVLAKVLQRGGGGGGGGGGGHHHEPRYPSMHYPGAQVHVPMMHPAPYPQHMQYAPQHMMQGAPQHMMHNAPQPIMYNGQQGMGYQAQPAHMLPQQAMPYSVQTSNQISYGHFPEFEPKDKLEVISI